ncbi:MAG: [protein-PII] uridylyltransferase [Maricaulaceae bacterium]
MNTGFEPSPIDGAALRRALTDAALAHEGDEPAQRAAALPILRAAWSEGRETARRHLYAGGGGLETARALAQVADDVVSALYDFTTVHVHRARNPTEGERLSVCAGGGYGRGELAPFSDLDLHFVRAYKLSPWIESVIETMLLCLFDMRIIVGNSARSIDQAVRLAKEDWTVLTNLFDLRRIAGDAEFPETLSHRLREEVLLGRSREFVTAKLDERAARLIRQGASRYMVEPDVKNGKGGLRDLQTLDWLARGVSAGRGGSAAAALLFRREEARRFDRASDFLWRVRCFMHFATGRAQEKLSFDLQPEIAALMGYEDTPAGPGVERFMRQYFLVARDVGSLTRIMCAKLEAEETKNAPKTLIEMFGLSKKPEKPSDPRFKLEAGRIAFTDTTQPERDPSAMISLFNEAARIGVDVHPDALSVVDRALDRVDDRARRTDEMREAFLAALLNAETVDRGFRMMNEASLLGAVMPEFGGIVARTQFNMYHHYTVDEHTLRVVSGLAALETGDMGEDSEFAAPLFEKLSGRRALYLSALLHDVGKGHGDQQIEGAKLALEAGERLGLAPEEIELVSWLVGHHLVMSDVAQRRDIGEPRTIADFAEEIGTTERLRLLTLLTIADINAVGPGVWNPWKRRLIQDLYALTEATFRGERAAAEQARHVLAERAAAARERLIAGASAEQRAFTEAWAESLEDAYWLQFDDEAHARHRDVAAEARKGAAGPEVKARWDGTAGGVELLVITPDHAGVFAAVASSIARSGGNVREARIYTTTDGLAVDFFRVTPAAEGDLHDDAAWVGRLQKAALAAITADAPPSPPEGKVSRRAAAFRVPASVAFDNDASDLATIIEVSGRDRPGLLAALGQALAELKLNILSANVESIGVRAMDVFYACEQGGGKILDEARREEIKTRLLEAFTDGEPTPPTADGKELARAPESPLR